jgi:hypothetical protein
MDWIDLAQNRENLRGFLHTVTNLRVPKDVGKFLSDCARGDFSTILELHRVNS